MCGIFAASQSQAIDSSDLTRSLNAIAHRGPDDHGEKIWPDHRVALGHRRLSIIDLSAAGHNPMPNEDGTIWIVFNGEIYNFLELRVELERAGHLFRSNTDTEVIIHAYEEWGDEHVHRLRGMFAYIIYDRRSAATGDGSLPPFRLLVVRDRLGIKPLFYYWNGETLLVASEIKAILAYPGVACTVDRSALFDYLTYRYVPTPKTAYTEIRKLPAGYRLLFEDGALRTEQYWEIDCTNTSGVRSEDEAIEYLRAALADAVQSHLISDVPLGVFLSGGIDSSMMAAFTAQSSEQAVRTFSIGFDVAEHSETAYAREVATYFKTLHYERIVGSESVQSMLPFIIQLYDEPFADSSAIPTYRVSAVAREQVKVALSGDGGDEIFGGYVRYTNWLHLQKLNIIPSVLRPGLFAFMRSVWPSEWRGKRWVNGLHPSPIAQYVRQFDTFAPEQKRQSLTLEWVREFKDYDDYWYFRQFWRDDLDPQTRLQYLDIKTYLVDDILTKVDRASMAVSLETRPPLLDHVLVEKIFALPAHLPAPNGERKYLLKRVAKDMLPSVVLNRSKKGFSVPISQWTKSEPAWLDAKLESLARSDVFRPDAITALRGGPTRLWIALVLQQWLSS